MNMRNSRFLLFASIALLAAGCATDPPAPPPAVQAPTSTVAQAPAATPAPPPVPAPPPGPPTPVPLEEALLRAANDLFSKAPVPLAGKATVVIDPLIDGNSGGASRATQSMEKRITALVKEKYPQFDVAPFQLGTVSKNPIVLVGTFTAINTQALTAVPPNAFRICLALADLKSGKIVSKGRAFAKMDGVDNKPTPYFADSPTWVRDRTVDGYIRSCQATQVGDPIDAVYYDRIKAAALIAEAIEAYNGGKMSDALDLYRSALRLPEGDQLRVHNGMYLVNWRMGRLNEASQAFGKIVDHGLANSRLPMKFLFRPGGTQLVSDGQPSTPYTIWLKQIAQRAAQTNVCLDIVGHTTRTGATDVNDRLSTQRAQFIKQRLEADSPKLAKRLQARGVGSRENLIGTASDDLADALDRRVEFKVIGC